MRYFQRWIFVLIVLVLGVAPVFAQDNETPQTVEVGVYVVGASEFNLDTGTYNVDFYLTMYCSLECTDDIVGFDVVGINGTESLQVEERVRQPQYAEYRIQAVLNQNDIDLTRYPFDSHLLNVIVESKFLLTDAVVYQVKEDETGIDPDVNLQGWNLSHDHRVSIVEKTYYGATEGYSRYIFTMTTSRVAVAAFIRSILPALVILIISFLGTFLPDRNNRIGLAGGILLAMLLHHLAVGAEIPAVGYPVYFDAFMLLNDAAILIQFAGTVYELVREKNGVADEVLDRFSYLSLVVIFVAWLVSQLVVWQVFMSINRI
jgi:hypothetical protein